MSCDNVPRSERHAAVDEMYFEGRLLYESKCAACHPFLPFDSAHSSVSELTRYTKIDLFDRINEVKGDSVHSLSPFFINRMPDTVLDKVAVYIHDVSQSKP